MRRAGAAARRAGALLLFLACAGCDRPLPGPTPDASTDAPSAAPSAAPHAAASAPLAEPPKRPRVAIGSGDDRRPERWTTPAESLKARPPWSREYPYSYDPKADRDNYAPQFWGMGALFSAAPKASVVPPGEQVLLVCRVGFAGFCDGGLKGLFGADDPELDVEMTIGRSARLMDHGGEDVRVIDISIPLVTLAPSDRLSFRVFDRDGGGDRDYLGAVTLTPKSLATKAKSDPSIECRVIGHETVEATLASEIAEVDKKLDELADAAPMVQDETLGAEMHQRGLRNCLFRLAGLVGWADPRVVRRMEWAARIEARIVETRARFINDEADRLARRAYFKNFGAAYTVEAAGITCGKEAIKPYASEITQSDRMNRGPIGCILRINATNVGEESLRVEMNHVFGWKAVLGRSDGLTLKAHMLSIEGPEVKRNDPSSEPVLPPGAKGTVVLGVSADIQPEGAGAPRPRLIVMNPFPGGGPVLFSLDAPPDRPIPDAGAEP